jgi:hypothetical protein
MHVCAYNNRCITCFNLLLSNPDILSSTIWLVHPSQRHNIRQSIRLLLNRPSTDPSLSSPSPNSSSSSSSSTSTSGVVASSDEVSLPSSSSSMSSSSPSHRRTGATLHFTFTPPSSSSPSSGSLSSSSSSSTNVTPTNKTNSRAAAAPLSTTQRNGNGNAALRSSSPRPSSTATIDGVSTTTSGKLSTLGEEDDIVPELHTNLPPLLSSTTQPKRRIGGLKRAGVSFSPSVTIVAPSASLSPRSTATPEIASDEQSMSSSPKGREASVTQVASWNTNHSTSRAARPTIVAVGHAAINNYNSDIVDNDNDGDDRLHNNNNNNDDSDDDIVGRNAAATVISAWAAPQLSLLDSGRRVTVIANHSISTQSCVSSSQIGGAATPLPLLFDASEAEPSTPSTPPSDTSDDDDDHDNNWDHHSTRDTSPTVIASWQQPSETRIHTRKVAIGASVNNNNNNKGNGMSSSDGHAHGITSVRDTLVVRQLLAARSPTVIARTVPPPIMTTSLKSSTGPSSSSNGRQASQTIVAPWHNAPSITTTRVVRVHGLITNNNDGVTSITPTTIIDE